MKPGRCAIPLILLALNVPSEASLAGGPHYQRIVSLSPSTTEILFELGLGDRVIGVTRFCTFPEEALSKEKVGGYLDPNYEAIAALEPDIVILLPEQDNVAVYLDELRIKRITVDNKTVADILGAIETMGKVFGADKRSERLISSIRKRIDRISGIARKRSSPRTLVTIGRASGGATIEEVYVAGRGTYYDELIEMAGGINACGESLIRYPMLTAEGIISLDPEVIIELVPDMDDKNTDEARIRKDWQSVPSVKAVSNGRIYVLTGEYTQIPGPRFILLLEEMAGILHPDTR